MFDKDGFGNVGLAGGVGSFDDGMVVGGGDGVCAGVGVGCTKPGLAYNYVGSSSWIALTVEKPIYDEQMRTMSWAHAGPGYLQPSGTMQTAGAPSNWPNAPSRTAVDFIPNATCFPRQRPIQRYTQRTRLLEN